MPDEKGQEEGVKAKAFLFVLGCIALCATFLVIWTDETVVPHHLLGVWRTSEPKFAGCKIEFRQGRLILGLATGEEERCRIEKVTSAKERDRKLMYTIHYRDSKGQKSTLSFLYDPLAGGTLQLKNHSETWERSE